MKTLDLDKMSRLVTEGHSSKGDQPKWQRGRHWYKADHKGYEALAEVLISRLLQQSNIRDFVQYKPVEIVFDGKRIPGCESENFRAENEQLIPFERLHRAYKGVGLAQTLAKLPDAKSRIKYTVDFIEGVTGLSGVGTYLTALVELDAFFLNEDRHTNNLAVLRREDTKTFRLCPVFDNGLSLLSDTDDYPANSDIYECIGRVEAKPFDTDFSEQLAAAESLYGAVLRLSFTKKDVSEALAGLDEQYSEDILCRVEQIVFEQMRKYSAFFSC